MLARDWSREKDVALLASALFKPSRGRNVRERRINQGGELLAAISSSPSMGIEFFSSLLAHTMDDNSAYLRTEGSFAPHLVAQSIRKSSYIFPGRTVNSNAWNFRGARISASNQENLMSPMKQLLRKVRWSETSLHLFRRIAQSRIYEAVVAASQRSRPC
jgi:hypothetical protein